MDFLSKIKQLRPVIFEWNEIAKKELGFGDGKQIGLIAQEVEKVFPELVVNNNKHGYKSLRSNWLPTYLLKAFQEQQKIIEKLEERINQLENLLKTGASK